MVPQRLLTHDCPPRPLSPAADTERQSPNRVTVGSRPSQTARPFRTRERINRGIVGFRFVITRLEGKWKMNQNREMQDRAGVVKGLGERGRADDREMAEFVSRSIVAKD